MAALHLAEHGKLDLHANVNNTLMGWKVPETSFTAERKVTAANLISHTSGVKNAYRTGVKSGQELPAFKDIISGNALNTPVEVIAVPGTKYRYSNVG